MNQQSTAPKLIEVKTQVQSSAVVLGVRTVPNLLYTCMPIAVQCTV